MEKKDNVKLDIGETEYEGYVSPVSPLHFDFRFTFSNQDKELKCLEDKQFIGRCKMIYRLLVNKIADMNYCHLGKYTSGFEIMNKAGDNCKAHIHIRFQSHFNKESMNRTIKRYLTEEFNEEYLGNKCYSFKPEHVRNPEEFYRYPLKQGLNRQLCRGFTEDQLTHMHEVAKESWFKACQVNQAKLDKRDKDDTLFLRVLALCKKNNDTSKRAIAKTFYSYYIQEDKPINRQVIEGYVLNALVKLNLITLDEVLDKHGY